MSFNKDGEWQPLIYLNEPINSEWTDFCPYMTPDAIYFFYSRRYSDPPESGWAGVVKGEVYWVDARVVFDLKGREALTTPQKGLQQPPWILKIASARPHSRLY